MNEVRSSGSSRQAALWLAVVLALVIATAHILIAQGILGAGELQLAEDAIAILNAAAGGCLLGGLLLLVRCRWLWYLGLLMNGIVLLFFFPMYLGRPAVFPSTGGWPPGARSCLCRAG